MTVVMVDDFEIRYLLFRRCHDSVCPFARWPVARLPVSPLARLPVYPLARLPVGPFARSPGVAMTQTEAPTSAS